MVHSNQIRKFELMDRYPRGIAMFPKVTLSHKSETNEIKTEKLQGSTRKSLKRGRCKSDASECPSPNIVRRSKRIKTLRDRNKLCLNYKE